MTHVSEPPKATHMYVYSTRAIRLTVYVHMSRPAYLMCSLMCPSSDPSRVGDMRSSLVPTITPSLHHYPIPPPLPHPSTTTPSLHHYPIPPPLPHPSTITPSLHHYLIPPPLPHPSTITPSLHHYPIPPLPP